MALSWTEKYRPRSLQEVLGNPQAVQALRDWAQAWQKGAPAKRAVLLAGPPGAGKTSAALALAHEFGWGVLELNASDVRSGPAIQKIAGQGARHETFSDTGEYFASVQGKRKLIVLDEADNLYERGGEEAKVDGESFSDRGGKRAIMETIATAQQPIVLIANDAYALTKGASSFSKQVLSIPFRAVTVPTIQRMLAQIAAAEGVKVDEGVLRDIAARAHGDARSAINDLQAVAEGLSEVKPGAADGMGERNRGESMFNAVAAILKGSDGPAARRIVQNLDETPDFLLLWLDENTPREYRDARDLADAYEWLSRADVFLGRVSRRQSYGLWGTATDLLTMGVTSAKDRPYPSPPMYQFPGWLRKMSSSKGDRALVQRLSAKLAPELHIGFRVAKNDLIPFLRRMFAMDADFAEWMGLRFGLEEDEVRYLLAEAPESYADQVVGRIEARRSQPAAQADVREEPAEESAPAPPRPPPGRSLFEF